LRENRVDAGRAIAAVVVVGVASMAGAVCGDGRGAARVRRRGGCVDGGFECSNMGAWVRVLSGARSIGRSVGRFGRSVVYDS